MDPFFCRIVFLLSHNFYENHQSKLSDFIAINSVLNSEIIRYVFNIYTMKIVIKNPMGYWTKEKCHEEALKYNNRGEFSRKNSTAYKASHKNKWIDEICNHMVIINKPNDYWTKEKCHEEALKYETKSEFSKNSPSAYVKSGASGWKDDICQHMKTNGNKYKRCIYSVEFSDNSVYIGLTYNFDKRCEQHLKDINSTVYKHYIHIGVKPKMLKLTDYLPVDNASKQESIEMNYYLSNGWNILNKAVW